MDGLFTLLSLCLVMAGGSFLAGILPLSLNLSQAKLRLVSTIGMGVLVGTALIVIIPEGVDTLYGSSMTAHSHSRRSSSRFQEAGRDLYHLETSQLHNLALHNTPNEFRRQTVPEAFDLPGPVIPDSIGSPPKTKTKTGEVGIMSEDNAAGQHQESHTEKHHAWIGIAMISGFMLMFLIDKMPQYTRGTKPRARTHHIALNNLGSRFNVTTSLDREEESESFLENTQTTESQNKSFATTTGLVIHAAADGIALGASSSTSRTGMSFVIFFAIMVHKAPAAFGLTSILLKQGLSKRMARAHLVMFSLSAPAGAFLTWVLVHLVGGGGSSSPESTQWWTGVLLLFSAGTFLYVAMHSMQEATSITHSDGHMNGSAGGGPDGRDAGSHGSQPSLKDLGAACFGMILPLFLQIGHAH